MTDTVKLKGKDVQVEILKAIQLNLLEDTFKSYTEGYLEDVEKDTINCYCKEDIEFIKQFSNNTYEQELLNEVYKLFEDNKIDLVVFEI